MRYWVVSIIIGLAGPSAGADCGTLEFVAIRPLGHSALAPCDSKVDKLACQVARGFSKFEALTLDGHQAYRIERADDVGTTSWLENVHPLETSPAIAEVNALRIEARRLVGAADPCEPNHIYLGARPVFGMGPAFVSSKRFALDGRLTTNVIMAEDAKAPYHLPLAMLSKATLRSHSYYELAIAHELAHGLTQDLYGVDGFARLEDRVVSRDGHMASATTDPRLAWIEGLAEGFEAYLGEKYLSPAQAATPFLDRFARKIIGRLGVFESYGWKGYVFTIPGTITTTFTTMLRIDDFVSDFLKAERQQAIRDNQFALRGLLSNLSHGYGIPLALGPADAEAVMQWQPESLDGIYSKEGATAFFVYRVLRAGLARELLATIAADKPRDLWEFATELRAELAPEQLALIADVYKALFTDRGRQAVSHRLRALIDPDNRRAAGFDPTRVEREYNEKLAAIALPERLPPPRDLWVEFWNSSLVHLALYGGMDRINLATAAPSRLNDFLGTLDLSKPRRQALLNDLLDARAALIDEGSVRSVEEFVLAWLARSKSSDARAAGAELSAMRACFQKHCLSSVRKK